jgi:hypothetical protein
MFREIHDFFKKNFSLFLGPPLVCAREDVGGFDIDEKGAHVAGYRRTESALS